MSDVFEDSYESMLLGVEVSLVATFGLVWFESRLAEIWVAIMVVGLLLTFSGLVRPAPGE